MILSRVKYSCTNEDLRAIISGLCPNKSDSVLAVAGSGDQAFALLEFSGEVVAVDSSEEQLDFMKRRGEFLRKGNYKRFLNEGFWRMSGSLDGRNSGRDNPKLARFNKSRRDTYFTKFGPERLERIRGNLENLRIEERSDILDLAQNIEGFSKIYFSNVFGFQSEFQPLFKYREILRSVGKNLKEGNLIYVSNHNHLIPSKNGIFPFGISDYWDDDHSKTYKKDVKIHPDLEEVPFLPDILDLDLELSLKARMFETRWKPAVYKRI